MANRSNAMKYVESLVLFINDNTGGLEAELNALLQALHIRKVRWTGRPIGEKKAANKGGKRE